MREWTVRFFREGDEDGILSVLMSAFRRWPAGEIDVSPLEHLRWKLCSGPQALAHHIVAEADGRIVGCRIIVVRRAKVGDRVLLSYAGFDNAVAPDFQRRGVLTAAAGHQRDAFARAFNLKIGLRTDAPSSDAMLRISEAGLMTNLPRTLTGPATPQARGESRGEDWQIRAVPRFDERLDSFWQAAAEPFCFIVEKNASSANWRYADRRAGEFTIKVAERGDELLGYAVLRTSYGRSYIVDLLVLPERKDVLRSLVSDGVRTLSHPETQEIECTLPRHHPYRRVLLELGFSDTGRRVRPYVGPAGLSSQQLAFVTERKAPIHLMLGDFDRV